MVFSCIKCTGRVLIAETNSASLQRVLSLRFRSTDYGTTYEKLNEKVGVKTILSYLYVSPNNKRKVSPDCFLYASHAPFVHVLLIVVVFT